MCVSDLDHGGDRVHSAHVLDDALGQVCHAQADGPVGVALQLDHLVGTETQHSTLLTKQLQDKISAVGGLKKKQPV